MTSLTEQTTQKLKNDILSGKYAPGCKLKLSELKARYQVGLSPIREALFTLSFSGLVKNESQKGFFVPDIIAAEIEDLYRIRLLTDAKAIELCCLKGDDTWETNLLTSYYQLQKLETQTDNLDHATWEKTHKLFHKSLISGCGSEKLLELFDIYYDQALRYRNYWFEKYNKSYAASKSHHNEHKKLLNAMLNRDSALAITLLEKHFQKIVNAILQDIK